MNKTDFLHVVSDPSSITHAQILALEELARRFPFCQIAHVIQAMAAHTNESMLSNQKLRTAAVYICDRSYLKTLISLKPKLVLDVDFIKYTDQNISLDMDKNSVGVLDQNQNQDIVQVHGDVQNKEKDAIKVSDFISDPDSYSQITFQTNQENQDLNEPTNQVAGVINKNPDTNDEIVTPHLDESELTKYVDTNQNPIVNQDKYEQNLDVETRLSDTETVKTLEIVKTTQIPEIPEIVEIPEITKIVEVIKTTEVVENNQFNNSVDLPTEELNLDRNKIKYSNTNNNPQNINLEILENIKILQINKQAFRQKIDTLEQQSFLSPIGAKLFGAQPSNLNSTKKVEPKNNPIVGISKHDIDAQMQLISSFIDKQRDYINKNTAVLSSNSPSNEDLSSVSMIKTDSLISETLAKLFEKQGKKQKAIEMYEKLCLKYPEKSAYFVSQIQKLAYQI